MRLDEATRAIEQAIRARMQAGHDHHITEVCWDYVDRSTGVLHVSFTDDELVLTIELGAPVMAEEAPACEARTVH